MKSASEGREPAGDSRRWGKNAPSDGQLADVGPAAYPRGGKWAKGGGACGRSLLRKVARATLPPMTRGLAAIKQSIEALPMDDKAQLLEAVMTPQMRLRLLVNQVRRRGDAGTDRRVDRVVNRAVKRVRRAAGTR